VRTITSFDVEARGSVLMIDIKGRSFLRNVVRRMVAAVAEVGKGRATLEEVSRALDGEDIPFGLAPPEPLTLMDVDYGIEFEVQRPPTLRRKVSAYQLDARLPGARSSRGMRERLEQ